MTILLLAKLRKSRIFKGHSFSNIVKIKLFVADSQSYIPLELNRIVGNVHLFKLTGIINLDKLILKKNWIWDVLEIDWTDTHITLNDKEINLPISLVILLTYKIRTRKLFNKRNSLHVYIMLTQRISWYNQENDWD